MNHKKFQQNLAELKTLVADLKSIDREFWEEIDEATKLDVAERIITARNFLRVAHNHFDWE